MPTYIVTAPDDRLSPAQKAKIAAEITRTHCEVTAAPAYFAQVIFVDVKEGNYFLGGKPLATDHIFVHGQIRDGRSAEVKRRLLLQLLAVTAAAAGAPQSHVGVYLVDVPAQQIAEYGQILPGPGEEQAWTAALSPAVRERMEAIGR